MKEGSGFLLGLCDLFWFGKNRDVQRCSQCTARLFPLPQQQNKPRGLLQSQEIGAQSHSPAFGCWGGTKNPAPGSRCLCLFARKIYVQPWNLTMGALSSSPASLGYSSCCGMGTIFIQLAAAEPSCLGVHGLGVMSAMPLATRSPLTLTSLLREAQRRSSWGRAKRRAETEEFTDFSMCFQPLQLYLREKKWCWQEERRGKFTCAGKSGMCLDLSRAESQEQVYSKDRKVDLAKGIIFLLGTGELLITQVTSTI